MSLSALDSRLADGREPPFLQVQGVHQTYRSGQTPIRALHDVSFAVTGGDFVSIVGTSGSGKSTLLRILGGLLPPTAGEVWLAGRRVHEPQPDVGFVFQKSNLMPWRTVLENTLLPLEIQGRVGAAERARARSILETVRLAGFANAYPAQLSGGMAQRLALARALVQHPRLLLLDEPFGALDALTRERLNLELLNMRRLYQGTIVMVTHSIDEAVFLADRILVLGSQPGRLVADVPVGLPRPRSLDQLTEPLYNQLRLQVRHHIGALA